MLLFFGRHKDPSSWTASFGATIQPPKLKTGLRRIIVHEKYKYPSHDYDIALAELSRPIPCTNAVHKVCLPDANYEFQPGQQMFVTGFGAMQDDGEHLEGKKLSHGDLIWSWKAFTKMRVMTKGVGCSLDSGESRL